MPRPTANQTALDGMPPKPELVNVALGGFTVERAGGAPQLGEDLEFTVKGHIARRGVAERKDGKRDFISITVDAIEGFGEGFRRDEDSE